MLNIKDHYQEMYIRRSQYSDKGYYEKKTSPAGSLELMEKNVHDAVDTIYQIEKKVYSKDSGSQLVEGGRLLPIGTIVKAIHFARPLVACQSKNFPIKREQCKARLSIAECEEGLARRPKGKSKSSKITVTR